MNCVGLGWLSLLYSLIYRLQFTFEDQTDFILLKDELVFAETIFKRVQIGLNVDFSD